MEQPSGLIVGHANPALFPDTDQRHRIEEAGFRVAERGEVILLSRGQ